MLQALSILMQGFIVTLAVHSVTATATEVHPEGRCPRVSWKWGPLLPERRTAFGCCVTEDSIVVVGGTYWTSTDTQEPKKEWLTTVYRLRRDGDRWESLPDFPVPIDYALVVSWNERIYSVGGQNRDGVRSETYSIALGEPSPRWQPGPSLPRSLSRLRGGVWNSTIVAVTDEPMDMESGKSRLGPKILAWDAAVPGSDWVEISALPDASVGFRAACVAANKLYVFGGAAANSPQHLQLCDKVWCYNLEDKKWSACAPLPTPIRDATAIKISDRYIVVAGGVEEAIDAQSAPDRQPRILLSTRCLVYDCDNNQFTEFEPLRLPVADHGMATLGGELFVVGGEDSPYRTRTDLVQRCDVRTLMNRATQNSQQLENGKRGRQVQLDEGAAVNVRAMTPQVQNMSVGVIANLKTSLLFADGVGF